MKQWFSLGSFVLFALAILIGCTDGIDKPNENGSGTIATIAENEESAIHSLREIVTAEFKFTSAGAKDVDRDLIPEYGELAEIRAYDPSFLDAEIASGMKNGYTFTLVLPVVHDGYSTFVVTAEPINETAGTRSFFIDNSGLVRVESDGLIANEDSPPLEVVNYPKRTVPNN